ncbi:MAG: T9SS type A sorting domain-containing protein [Bacteroidetes bacterium]|nr:T9SS type A sorting domain-containing protein [Fibrella sp.]
MTGIYRRKTGFWLLISCLISQGVRAQTVCADRLVYAPVSQPNRIEWAKFPAFTLPFTIVFNGPRLGDTQAQPLRHGFSHIVSLADGEFGTFVQPRQRAVDWAGFAYGLNQPWETLQSPWNNDKAAYRAKWTQFLSDIAGKQTDSQGKFLLNTDIMSVDIERFLDTDTRILRLKQDPATPAQYRNLTDAAFLLRYKNDMVALYAEGMRFIRDRANTTSTRLLTYSDTPIRNQYLNIPANAWTDWTTNRNRVNYMTRDTTTGNVGGPFYDQLDALGPSAYYFYNYPNPLASDYLGYLLFQIEANRAWSPKPVIPYVWMRFHESTVPGNPFIQPFMAEATAIFPFFSGASGLWLWDNIGLPNTRQETYTAYESFIHGLYRLSRFSAMFEGDHELVIETPARDLVDKQLPVWRGVYKNNKLLVAAQNPYAKTDQQITTLTVGYKSWRTTITLTGRETYLCQFDIPVITGLNDPTAAGLSVFPNPAQTGLTVTFPPLATPNSLLTISDITGRIRLQQSVNPVGKQEIDVAGLPAGMYLLRLSDGRTTRFLKVQ